MTDRPPPWCDFIESLPSKNPYKHGFRVGNWFFKILAFHAHESGPFMFLNAIQGLAIVIAVVVFLFDLDARREERDARREERDARREERDARRLTSVSNAYSIITEVSRQANSDQGKVPGNRRQMGSRRQMVALEELHKYSEIADERFLASLIAPNVLFDLPRNTYSSGCEEKSDSRRVVLRGAYLDRAILNGASFNVADLSGAHLFYAKLGGTYFKYACLKEAKLHSANLSRAILSFADLSRADLSSADLSRADLSSADLSRADLSSADFSKADLRGVNLSGASLYGAKNLTQKQLDSACISSKEKLPKDLPNGYKAPPVKKNCPG